MSMEKFTVSEHWSPCQLIREYPHAVKQADADLGKPLEQYLAVKEYRPRDSVEPSENAVTIIASPGNGFPKECYEALWDEILDAAKGYEVRSIWMADYAHQGASYARNAEVLGDDPCWMDHSRDLLLMVNTFREKMKPPFVGVAHSMGCAHIANLALIHPRLFHSVVFIDPVIVASHFPGPNPALASSMRREQWDSRSRAEASFTKHPLFKSFDPRVLKAYLTHGLTDAGKGITTLTTPKAQEAWSYLRSNFHTLPEDTTTLEARYRERLINPDLLPFESADLNTFARGDSMHILYSLPHLRPRTLYLYGRRSHINTEELRQEKLELTGTGRGGNGGVKEGGTEMKIIDGTSHFVCFETPQSTANEISEWLAKETMRWVVEKDFWTRLDTGKSSNDRKDLSEKWIEMVKRGAVVPRPSAKDVAKL